MDNEYHDFRDLSDDPGFPRKFPTKQLEQHQRQIYRWMSKGNAEILHNRYRGFNDLVENELMRRSSNSFFYASAFLSITAIIIALISFLSDRNSTKTWQYEELKILQEIHEDLKDTTTSSHPANP